jgi:hypothetical protein
MADTWKPLPSARDCKSKGLEASSAMTSTFTVPPFFDCSQKSSGI